MRMSSGPVSRKEKTRRRLVELEGRHTEVEHDAVAAFRNSSMRENRPAQSQPAAEPLDQRLPAGNMRRDRVDASTRQSAASRMDAGVRRPS